jgi:hypothetical protein
LLLPFVSLAFGGQLMFAQTDFTGGAGGNIPDATSLGPVVGNTNAGIFTSDINVANPGTIASFNSITLDDFSHTWVGDLVFELEHVDSGTTIILMYRPLKVSAIGGYGSDSDLNGTYTFDNDLTSTYGSGDSIWLAANNNSVIPGGTYAASADVFTGSANTSYQPVNLNVFSSESIAGTWELIVRDESIQDVGTFSGWQFNATVEPAPEPAGAALMICGAITSFILHSFWRRPARDLYSTSSRSSRTLRTYFPSFFQT